MLRCFFCFGGDFPRKALFLGGAFLRVTLFNDVGLRPNDIFSLAEKYEGSLSELRKGLFFYKNIKNEKFLGKVF